MLLKHCSTLALFAVISVPAIGNAAHHEAGAVHAPAAESKSSLPLTDGEVKKVDREAGKLTLKHGPITNLGMPAMTMVFRVKDPAMLNSVKKGDKIRFAANSVEGAMTVVQLETGASGK